MLIVLIIIAALLLALVLDVERLIKLRREANANQRRIESMLNRLGQAR